MPPKPVIFLTFANDHQGRFLESLRPEQAGLHHQLAKYQNKGLGLYHSSGATEPHLLLQDLHEYSGQIIIFHYSGHSDGIGLQLETASGDEIFLHGGNLSSLLQEEARQQLKLVFLNACKSKGILASLQEAGVPAVIATDGNIPDSQAKIFSIAFYRSLISGNPLETAFSHAKVALEPHGDAKRIFRSLIFEDKEGEEDFPWGLYIQEEKVLDWKITKPDPLSTLPSIAQSYYQKLPKEPFRNLQPFTRKHAGIFYGRGQEILDLYRKIKSIYPVILYHGQSGVGKSSLLEAGLLPRIENEYQLIHLKRSHEGCDRDLLHALGVETVAESREKWLEIEEGGKPLLIILDQVEEAYTQQAHAEAESELNSLFLILSNCFDSEGEAPEGRLILSYRKEYHPEIEHIALDFSLPYTDLFLERLKRKGIVEAIEGTTKNPYTQDKYGIVLEANESGELAGIIADDLLEDSDSALAPVLQILLSRMWEFSEDKHFSISLYQDLKREGYLLQDFFERQMDILTEKFPEEVRSGLALDLLHTYTTALGSSNSHIDEHVLAKYEHISSSVSQLLHELVEIYLLFSRQKGERSLSHDTLAPIVQKNHKDSDSPGQRALRILENKTLNSDDSEALLDQQDLETVESGFTGMRSWTAHEIQLIERSREQQQKIHQQKRFIRQIGIAAFGMVCLLSGIAIWQWRLADKNRKKMQSSFYASEAISLLKTDPNKARETAVKAWDFDPSNDYARKALYQSYYQQPYDYQGETYFGLSYENFPQDSFLFPSPVYALDHSPDADELLITFWDGSVRLYESSGKEIMYFPGDGVSRSRTARFAPDNSGNFAFAVSDSVFVFDRKMQKKVGPLEAQEQNQIQKVAFSPDGDILYIIGDDRIAAFNWALEEQLSVVYIGPGTSALSISQKGEIFSGSSDGFVREWKLEKELNLIDSFQVYSLPITASELLYHVPENHIGPSFVTASLEGEISLFDSNRKLLKTLPAHQDEIYSLRFSKDGHYLLSSSLDGSSKIWSMQPPFQEVISLLGHESGVYHAVFSPDEKFAYSSSIDGSVKKWNLMANSVEFLGNPGDTILHIDHSPQSQKMLLTNSSGNWILSTQTGNIAQIRSSKSLRFSIFSPNPQEIISLTEDSVVKLEVWNRAEEKLSYQYVFEHEPFSIFVTPNQKYLLALKDFGLDYWTFEAGVIFSDPESVEHDEFMRKFVEMGDRALTLDEMGGIAGIHSR